MKALLVSIALLCSTVAMTGCGSKLSGGPSVEDKVALGNAKLSRMHDIQVDLSRDGIYLSDGVQAQATSSAAMKAMNLKLLQKIQALLEEYVRTGYDALALVDGKEVVFSQGSREGLVAKIEVAQRHLARAKQEIEMKSKSPRGVSVIDADSAEELPVEN